MPMTPAKILYRFDGQHRFYGLVGMPEKPKLTGKPRGEEESINRWIVECDRIKSEAPEIVNPEMLDIVDKFDALKQIQIVMNGELVLVKDGDTFDLPANLELKEEEQQRTGFTQYTSEWVSKGSGFLKGTEFRKVFRIVLKTDLLKQIMDTDAEHGMYETKAEPESQEEMYTREDVKAILKGFATYIDQDRVESPSIYRKISDQWLENQYPIQRKP